MTTWHKLISEELENQGERWDDVVFCTLKHPHKQFDAGYGSSEGTPFTLWTKKRVYFPVVYDGAEWVGSVPRHPCDEETIHIGSQ